MTRRKTMPSDDQRREVPPLWPAQAEAVDFALARPATMLDMGMGCGKTRVAIEVVGARPDVAKVLVVCPKAVLTDHNRRWKPEQLLTELLREQDAIRRQQR